MGTSAMRGAQKKIAVLLVNLGGPDDLKAVQPFLFNLFSDPAIIGLANPFRKWLASFIAWRRAPKARAIYEHIGGRSPLLENTQNQAQSLQAVLGEKFLVLPVMRYWHPRAREVASQLTPDKIEHVIILPLYPQYSTTTTKSSYVELKTYLEQQKMGDKISLVCCYPLEEGWLQAMEDNIRSALSLLQPNLPYRMIFTAHGLPQRVIEKGDPYQYHVELTADALVKRLNIPALNWVLAYQSRVGPLKWLGPATDAEIIKAGHQGLGVVVIPIAFVSEHSETLVELDIEYRALAQENGVPFYRRVPTVATHSLFIKGLANLVGTTIQERTKVVCPFKGKCDNSFRECGGRLA